MNPPTKPLLIYLQCYDEYGEYIPSGYDVSWCDQNINGNDEPYVTAVDFLYLLTNLIMFQQGVISAAALQRVVVEKYTSQDWVKAALGAVKSAGQSTYEEEE